MKIITIQDIDRLCLLNEMSSKIQELEKESIIVNISVFFDSIDEMFKSVICYYE